MTKANEFKKSISVRLKPENIKDFYELKDYLSQKNPLLQDLNNNQLVNHCIGLALDYYEQDLINWRQQNKKTKEDL